MSSIPADELVRGIVRGEMSVELLESLGLHFSHDAGAYRIDGAGTTVVRPGLEDVAMGIINCARADVSRCREWAAVILAASAVIDLACLETSQEGASLLDALWDAADCGVIMEDTVAVAREIVQASGAQA